MIEAPEVESRVFSNLAKLKSGETLVLSGFENSTDSGTRSGVGDARNFLLGGGLGAETKRDVIVVLITPTVTQ